MEARPYIGLHISIWPRFLIPPGPPFAKGGEFEKAGKPHMRGRNSEV